MYFILAFSISHGNGYNFSNKELLSLTPDHIYAYLSFKVFGTSTPLENDKPTQDRSNSIEYSKKKHSVIFAKSIDEMESGNPTKSVKVNK